ncbi:unnamed protein product, partial [Acanthoscelides obtectus]
FLAFSSWRILVNIEDREFSHKEKRKIHKTEIAWKTIPTVEVQGVLGKKGDLPCDITPRDREDAVAMVLWFKETIGEPLYRGQQREARVLGPPCQCKKNCRQLLQGTGSSIFNSFWDLNTYDQQNTYLFSTIKVIPKKRSYKKKIKRQESARKVTNQYFVKVNGVDVQICKTEFLSVHGLQNSSKRLKFIARQISEGRTTPKRNGRGKYQNRPNRTSAERVQSIHDHIQTIPKYLSHYSRKVNPNRVFLNHDLNISTLYQDYYVEWCKERAIAVVKEYRYRRIFCFEYNIAFKLPKSDTCHTCDLLNNQMEANKENQDEYNKLRIQLQLHQTRADAMQESLRKEQTLPTASLTVGPAFYLRKAWTFTIVSVAKVYCPEDWVDIVKKSNRKNPFGTVLMQQLDFYKFDSICMTKKNVTVGKEPIKFSEVRCFKFDSENPNSRFIKHNLNGEFLEVNVRKRGSRLGDQRILNNLRPEYDVPVALNVKKIQDLKKLLKYIPPVSEQFFVDIVGDTFAAESENEQTEGEEGVENIDGDEEAADIE